MKSTLMYDFLKGSAAMTSLDTKSPTTSSRILLDTPCKVCQDHSSGKHYGIYACDGCAGFFKRSIRRNRKYVCKARGNLVDSCPVDKTHRNQCRSCRLNKCVTAGMNQNSVQHERGPRNSTIRRQNAPYIKDSGSLGSLTPPTYIPQHPTAFLNRNICCPPPPLVPSHMLPMSMYYGMGYQGPLLYPIPQYPYSTMLNYPFSSSSDNICDNAACLLFRNFGWAKAIPAFARLLYSDRVLLMQENWRGLFLVSAAQFDLPLEHNRLFADSGLSSESQTSQKMITIRNEITAFQEIVISLQRLLPDPTEYNYLKMLILFTSVSPTSSADGRSLSDSDTVTSVQEQTHVALSSYIHSMYPTQPLRLGRLLLVLLKLGNVSNSTIEEVFLRKALREGAVHEAVVVNMLTDQPSL